MDLKQPENALPSSFAEVAENYRAALEIPGDTPLPPEAASAMLAALGAPFTVKTLTRMRSVDPHRIKFHHAARRVFYLAKDLREYAERQRQVRA